MNTGGENIWGYILTALCLLMTWPEFKGKYCFILPLCLLILLFIVSQSIIVSRWTFGAECEVICYTVYVIVCVHAKILSCINFNLVQTKSKPPLC